MFDPGTSKSLVPEKFRGVAELEHAYVVNERFSDYEKARSAVLIHCDTDLPKEKLLAGIAQAYGAKSAASNIVFAVAPKHLVEYVFFENPADAAQVRKERQARFARFYKQSTLILLRKQPIGSFRVRPGQGLDAQW